MFSDNPTVRKIIYAIAIAAQIAAVFLTLNFPELAAAFVSAAGILSSLAGATALSNITPAGTIGVDTGVPPIPFDSK